MHDITSALIRDPRCPHPPARKLVHRLEEYYSGKDYNLDPFNTNIITPSTSAKIRGLVDCCLYANPTSPPENTAKRIDDEPESIILIHEVKPPGLNDESREFFVPPAAAQDVDRQIRRGPTLRTRKMSRLAISI